MIFFYCDPTGFSSEKSYTALIEKIQSIATRHSFEIDETSDINKADFIIFENYIILEKEFIETTRIPILLISDGRTFEPERFSIHKITWAQLEWIVSIICHTIESQETK